jgi:hypothetical protein
METDKVITAPIEYKGYTIQPDPERNPYNKEPELVFFPTDAGIQHDYDYENEGYRYCGNCGWAGSVEECQYEIDELIYEKLEEIKQFNAELISEVEQLITHSEQATIDYTVLEHARKVVFKIKMRT